MKGVVFTEFLEMVEQHFNADMVDDIIAQANPSSGGAYTSVGTYEFEELANLIGALSAISKTPANELIHAFGLHLAQSFASRFPAFFDEAKCTFDLLKKVDDHIHVEVRKLYPDAELPKFDYEQSSPETLTLFYESSRNLPDLAHGLIEGAARYYQEEITIQRSGKIEDGICHEIFQLKVSDQR